MTEWEIVEVIAAMVSLFFLVAKPIIKLNGNISELNTIVKELKTDISSLTKDNAEEHKKFTNELGNHETRITVLEKMENLSR